MSRIGQMPVALPAGVTVQAGPGTAVVKGPKGQMDVPVHPLTKVDTSGGTVRVTVENEQDGKTRALWGLTRALLNNAVHGVNRGWEKRLVVVGVGYRVDARGKNLELQVGYSHTVVFPPLEGVTFALEAAPAGIEGAQTTIVVTGVDRERVGRVAANIRAIRPPEPYKGKGIRYSDELVRLKPGKSAVV